MEKTLQLYGRNIYSIDAGMQLSKKKKKAAQNLHYKMQTSAFILSE